MDPELIKYYTSTTMTDSIDALEIEVFKLNTSNYRDSSCAIEFLMVSKDLVGIRDGSVEVQENLTARVRYNRQRKQA